MHMKFVFIYRINIKKEHGNKDVFLIPYYLNKIENIKTRIVWNFVDYDKWCLQWEWKLQLLNVWFKWWGGRNFNIIKYILWNFNEIDILWLIHINRYNILWIIIYKLLNHNWKIYIKLDDNSKKKEKYFNKKIINLLIWSLCDVISVETLEWYKKYEKFWNLLKRKLVLMPNWYNEDLLENLYPKIKSWEEKDNIIITVSRIWSYQKNSELMLDILKKISLETRKVYIIWTIDKDFSKKIEKFYSLNPNLIWKVIFTWPIYDKKELYRYYNDAKIFLLTSRSEWFPLVFPDALYFWNRIITTDVSSSEDITNNWEFWDIVHQDNIVIDNFCSILQYYINWQKNNDSINEHQYCKEHFNWKHLIKIPATKLWLFKYIK